MRLPVQLRKRKSDTHKGDYGHVLVLGGSHGLSGAVCLCAQAALRCGAGLVTAAVPQSLSQIIAIKLTEVMSLALPDQNKGILLPQAFSKLNQFLNKIDVIALGCGASQNKHTQKFIRDLVVQLNKKIVIDADGLNAISADLTVLTKRQIKNLILTPHLGEFSRLCGLTIDQIKKNTKKLVKEFAFRYNLVLVVKGFPTLISDGNTFFENYTGNSGMATAGSGDVLTGIISGLLAQGMSNLEASRLGVYLHGLAGDLAVKEKTQPGLIASDIIEYLPKAMKAAR